MCADDRWQHDGSSGWKSTFSFLSGSRPVCHTPCVQGVSLCHTSTAQQPAAPNHQQTVTLDLTLTSATANIPAKNNKQQIQENDAGHLEMIVKPKVAPPGLNRCVG